MRLNGPRKNMTGSGIRWVALLPLALAGFLISVYTLKGFGRMMLVMGVDRDAPLYEAFRCIVTPAVGFWIFNFTGIVIAPKWKRGIALLLLVASFYLAALLMTSMLVDRGESIWNMVFVVTAMLSSILASFISIRSHDRKASGVCVAQPQTAERYPLHPISSQQSPRQILAEDYPALNGGPPISGGWGYTKEDACVIEKDDPLINPQMPFDGVSVEYVFVEKRIYEEMIIFRPKGYAYSGIEWRLLSQSLIHDRGRVYDHLEFEITAFEDADWASLRAEYSRLGSATEEHLQRRQSLMKTFRRDFWFDITSFYGK